MSTVALIRAVMRLTEPGGVGVPAPPRRDDIDLAVDRDPAGRPHLPGTTLAGGLRAMVAGYGGDGLADRLFGHLTEKDPARETVDTVASPIWTLGAQLLPDGAGGDPGTAVRQVTAIDRHRGAARSQTLHREEVLTAGTSFEAFLRWDGPAEDELHTFLSHLGGWRPLIGHAVSRGRGRVVVDEVSYGILDLSRSGDLAVWLRGDGPDLFRDAAVYAPQAPAAADGFRPARVAVPVRIDGPLRVGSGVAEPASDGGAEVVRLSRVGGRFVLPGSGLKGLLRSRCEYILRSLDARSAPCLDQRCGGCWPCEVFGYGGGESHGLPGAGSRALVRVLDAEVADATRVERTHVAIDRFTGGAREEQLYTLEALEAGTFTLTIELLPDLTRSQERQLRALLRLVVADLADGLLGVGGAVARGYGSVSPDPAGADLPALDEARATLRDLVGRGGLS